MARSSFILFIILFGCIFLFGYVVAQSKEPGWQIDLVKQMFNSTAMGRKYIRRNEIYNSDICTWGEFSCDLNMRFTRFQVYTIYFGFHVPEAIGELTSLEILHLGGGTEDIVTTIPSVIGSLSNLRSLKFGPALSDTIPDSIVNLRNLEDIDLSSNSLRGTIPSGFGANQPKLKQILLGNNKLTGTIPDELVRGPVEILYLSDNRLTGSVPPVIYECEVLVLLLANNQLTIFEETTPRPTKLTSCSMANNPFICPIPQWAIDECRATCTTIESPSSSEGLPNSTIAIIISSSCALAIVVVVLALIIVRKRNGPLRPPNTPVESNQVEL